MDSLFAGGSSLAAGGLPVRRRPTFHRAEKFVIPPVVVHCGFGGLLAVGSFPLALRLVPMNRLYGIRIPKAFASESNWYAINALGGRVLTAYGVALFAFGLLARDSAPPPTSIWTAVFIVGPMLLVLPLLGLVGAYARRLP